MKERSLYNGKQFPDYVFSDNSMSCWFVEFDFVFDEEFWVVFKKFLENSNIVTFIVENVQPKDYTFYDEIYVEQLPTSFLDTACINIIHSALLRLATGYKKLDVDKLEAIRNKILENNFSFDIPYKSFINPKHNNLVAKIIIQPQENTFAFYVTIEEDGKEKCKVFLYNGKTTDYYITALFSYGKWHGTNKVAISGKYKEVEMHVDVNTCSVDTTNFSKYDKPPFFEMMKSNLSEEDKQLARNNWFDSLPPGIADFIQENEV